MAGKGIRYEAQAAGKSGKWSFPPCCSDCGSCDSLKREIGKLGSLEIPSLIPVWKFTGEFTRDGEYLD